MAGPYVVNGYWIIGYAEGDSAPVLLEGTAVQEWSVTQDQPIFPVWLAGSLFQVHDAVPAPLTLEKALAGTLQQVQGMHELVPDLLHRGMSVGLDGRLVTANGGLRMIVAIPPRAEREDLVPAQDRTVISRR